MKIQAFTTITAFFVAVTAALAVYVSSFTSWDDLIRDSKDIVVVRCTKTTPENTPINDMVWSDIEVLSVLKGETKVGAALMASTYWPRQGERFLLFSNFQNTDVYKAYISPEEHRIVPLGRFFQTDKLAGKKLNEQIQLILLDRKGALTRDSRMRADEMKRLEQAPK